MKELAICILGDDNKIEKKILSIDLVNMMDIAALSGGINDPLPDALNILRHELNNEFNDIMKQKVQIKGE